MKIKTVFGALLVMSVMLASCEKDSSKKHGANGHEWVDLGLSVKWATCNVGASKPEYSGWYYQWAGIQDVSDTKNDLCWANCPYHTGSDPDTDWTKYVPSLDNHLVLDPGDDVASVEWKGGWRMPTYEEWVELMDKSNCSWMWTSINDVYGYKVVSRKPGYVGNWIFLPAAGLREGKNLKYEGKRGIYWSSSLETDSPYNGHIAEFHSDDFYMGGMFRFYGYSVRPVLD